MSKLTYLLELFSQSDYKLTLASTPNDFEREYNIYYFDTVENSSSYWVTTWGGFFDTQITTNLQVFYGVFLAEVTNDTDLLLIENSYYVSGTKVFMNLPKKPWQYFKDITSLNTPNDGFFSSNVSDGENEQSNWKFSGSDEKFKPYLEIPSINNKISSPISDISLQQQFSLNILNNDGLLDYIEEKKYYNIPIELRKSNVESPSISDFNIIHKGYVENVSVDFNKLKIKTVDYNKLFTQSVTDVLTVSEYPNLPSDNIGKSIPIAYGEINNANLILVEDGGSYYDYIVIEPSDVFSVSDVYDGDGNSISFTNNSGVIRTTVEASSTDFIGKINNKIGEIIKDLLNNFSSLKYISTYWDLTETDTYINLSKEIGFFFEQGDLKTAIDQVLKNDNAFLMTKNNGLLTIRQWGQTYDEHEIEPWQLINEKKIIKKTDFASKYYQSTVRINYNKDYKNNSFNNTYINDSRENEISGKFQRSSIQKYDSLLTNEDDAVDLSDRLLDRFGAMPFDLSIETSTDTSQINLLDTVYIELAINDRVFSDIAGFIVKEVNPAQDRLLLESLEGIQLEKAMLDQDDLAILDENDKAIMEVV